MADGKIYIHETIDIIGQHRAAYLEHMTAGWDREARAARGMKCFGVWGTVGSTERWPQVVNMWELDGWAGLAGNFAHELSHDSMQDPELASWWATAKSYRSGGLDRIMLPAEYSPTIDELCSAPTESVCYLHELVSLRPGAATEYLGRVGQHWVGQAGEQELGLVGAFRTAMVNDSEALLIWSVPSWPQWAVIEEFLDGSAQVRSWRRRSSDLVLDWRRKLLCSAPQAPLRTGQQP
ncbi:hypothetical protein, partial [Nakamurella lactea]|uniref:hypothetical protein n=1 Tax=Nakamurella lactea TaxID=459515 RepID=UPI00040D2307